jgi:hypothetical protein
MADLLVGVVCVALLSGLVTAKLAARDGRNPALWFLLGVAVPLVAVALLSLVSKKGRAS